MMTNQKRFPKYRLTRITELLGTVTEVQFFDHRQKDDTSTIVYLLNE